MLGFGLSNGLLVAWVVVQPADARLTAVVSTIGGVLVPLLAVPLCFGWPKRWWRTAGDDQLQLTRVPLLLGLGILTHSLGEVVFAYYVIAFDHPPPMPSLATIGFLGQYPFLLLARGQVVLPLGPGECRVEITLA